MFENRTGIVLFAKGVVTYFRAPNTIPNAEVVKDALKFFRRAVSVLEKTHGREAIWTLAATYRMAVCLFDLGEYEEAMSVQPPPLFPTHHYHISPFPEL